jgi:hypothetical protein
LGLYDIARGYFTYHTNWFWATFMTYLSDGRVFSVNFGDGIGPDYKINDKAYEDFTVLDGKLYKLD